MSYTNVPLWLSPFQCFLVSFASRQDFSERNNRAIDELWYKRAVEQHFIEANSFIYSVPFNAAQFIEETNDTLVTASHAVFHTEGGKKTPAAVVGFQFRHSALVALMKNTTSTCTSPPCTNPCASDSFDCYLLDNNAYVIVGPRPSDTGRAMGDVQPWAMKRFVVENIYKEVVIYDYQGVCFAGRNSNNAGNILQLVRRWNLNI